MKKKLQAAALTAVAALMLPGTASAQNEPLAPSTPPKLLVVIAVDQFSADVFAEYRELMTSGLARLQAGVVFPSGYQAHGATETCPGHSTILTGSHPARTGIVANHWANPSLSREDKAIYCAEDESQPGTSSGSGKYVASVDHLLVPTLGDLMKARDPAAKIVAVAGKDRAAIMMGGRRADELLWLDAKVGLTSYRGTTLSPTATAAGAAIVRALGTARPAMDLPKACAARDIAVPIGAEKRVGTGRFARAAGNMRGFLASPEADGAVLASAAALRAAGRMGEGGSTDLLIVGLSASDYVGHTYGTGGSEMCLQLLALDRELGDFLMRLDATGIDYAAVLTADHGGHDIPERNRQNALPQAERIDAAFSLPTIAAKVAEELKLPGDLFLAEGSDLYLNRSLTTAQRQAASAAIVNLLSKHRQIAAVVTRETLSAMPIPTGSPQNWTVEQRIRASFHPDRSGDILFALKPDVTPIAEADAARADRYVATHGSVWDYDRRVPILFWRKGMAGFEQPNPVMTVDIMPTLAALIGLPLDMRAIDGRCLDLLSGPASSCP